MTVRLEPDVIDDLIALVQSDVASEATVDLIDELARTDPSVRRRLTTTDDPWLAPAPPEADLELLKTAKRRASLRATLLGCAWFSSLSVFSFAVIDEGFRWLVIGTPLLVPVLSIALVLWALVGWLGRR